MPDPTPTPLAKSIATVSLSGTLADKLDAAAAIGFDGVEIFENDPFEDRFFFEIVQRIGGYQQYGAASASVRMAAQARRRETPRTELLA